MEELIEALRIKIVEILNLPDVTPADIPVDGQLVGTELGIDSIDVLEMVVMIENAGEGSTVAAPMFRQVVEAYYGLPLTPLPAADAVPQGD